MRNAAVEVVDYAGRTVKIEKPAEKVVVMADNALVVVKQIGGFENVIALDSKSKSYLRLSILSKTDPEAADLPDAGKTKSPNYEYLISLSPDLILFKGDRDSAHIIEEKTGVPVVCVKSLSGYDFNLYSFIGKLLGRDKKAASSIRLFESHKAHLEQKLSAIPECERKSAYIVLQNSKNNPYKTQKIAQSLDLAGIANAAANAQKFDEWGTAELSKEEILNLTPDLVFLDYPASASGITKDFISGDATFLFMDAVKQGKIYFTYSFTLPKDYIYVIAEAYYYANLAYPAVITEDEYESAVNALFEAAYGIKIIMKIGKNHCYKIAALTAILLCAAAASVISSPSVLSLSVQRNKLLHVVLKIRLPQVLIALTAGACFGAGGRAHADDTRQRACLSFYARHFFGFRVRGKRRNRNRYERLCNPVRRWTFRIHFCSRLDCLAAAHSFDGGNFSAQYHSHQNGGQFLFHRSEHRAQILRAARRRLSNYVLDSRLADKRCARGFRRFSSRPFYCACPFSAVFKRFRLNSTRRTCGNYAGRER